VLTAQEPSAKYLVNLQPPLVRHFDLIAQAPGGVARLRELILTLAVQGKLVPQDPSDEPASELLKKIRTEKDRLIADGKIKRDKPLAEIADEEKPFELPNGWVWASLAGVGIINPRNDEADETVASFVQMSSIPVQFSEAHVVESRPWSAIKSGFTHFAEGDVGVAKITPCFENGKSTVFRNLSNRIGAGTTELHIVRPLCGIDPRYVLLFLKTPTFLKEGEAVMTGSAGQKRLPRNYFENKPFSLPPLAEQSRIVTRVEELMQLCDALEASGQLEAQQHAQLVSTLLGTLTQSETPEELADNWQRIATHFDVLLDRPEAVDALEQTILQLAVRGLLVPQDPTDESASVLFQKIRTEKDHLIAQGKIKRDKPLPPITDEEKPFELPRGWEWARFPELGEFGRGKSKHRPRNDPALFNPPIYPVVQTGEVARAKGVIQAYHSKYSEIGLAQSRLWPEGTLCITIAANIADAALLGFEACFPDSVVGFVPAQTLGNAKYFLAFMETARNDLIKFAPATAQKNINLEILEALLIPVPPLAEMSRIVTRVNELRNLCADLRARILSGQAAQRNLADALVASD
jgi:type I restriction enzyme S subunit